MSRSPIKRHDRDERTERIQDRKRQTAAEAIEEGQLALPTEYLPEEK